MLITFNEEFKLGNCDEQLPSVVIYGKEIFGNAKAEASEAGA